jgi:hypothetical protein
MTNPLPATCQQLRIREIKAMNALQEKRIVSDNAVGFADVADADIPAAVALLNREFGPEQTEFLPK